MQDIAVFAIDSVTLDLKHLNFLRTYACFAADNVPAVKRLPGT